MKPSLALARHIPLLWFLVCPSPVSCALFTAPARPDWTSPGRYHALLSVDPDGRSRTRSPVSIQVNFQALLRQQLASGRFDGNSVEVFAYRRVPSRRFEQERVAHRLDPLFGAPMVELSFVQPGDDFTNFLVYFDTVESGRGRPRRAQGLLGDGDRFREAEPRRREVAPTHFDCFVDFDGDGDLDLFRGGVEPFVYCWENVGHNRLVDRGRLASDGALLKLPCSRSQRSWVTVAFHDIDGDGDLDLIPSFGDGPDAGKIVLYRNPTHAPGDPLRFTRVGPLQTESGSPLAGGPQAGGWFPSIALVADWDGDGIGPDALVGSRNRCWLYRGRGAGPNGAPRFADAVPLRAGGKEIDLVNPRFAVCDIDHDGDLDLFAGTQPGPAYWFENIGARGAPNLASGRVVAWAGRYLIGDAHSGIAVADFDRDGLPDLASGRFWERVDLDHPASPRVFGGFWKNAGTASKPLFAYRPDLGPFTEQFQPCDAVRQNAVRAIDWDGDGLVDLLAGDTDGFIWFFRNRAARPRAGGLHTGGSWARFAPPQRLKAGSAPLSVAASGGHARFDVCDWNNDGAKDLVVADASGTLTLFLNRGGAHQPSFGAGVRLTSAQQQPIQLAGRASVVVCDWDNDGRKDLLLADEKGYAFSRNIGTDPAPRLELPRPILFGGRPVAYVRPNLGAFVDWDGDGRRDLIGCHFENSIRFYRNLGSGAPGEEPRFEDPEGVVLLEASSPQMISGADAVDWNGDGRLDLLTGQGHGGSGLRFYERQWLEDERRAAHPVARLGRVETKP